MIITKSAHILDRFNNDLNILIKISSKNNVIV